MTCGPLRTWFLVDMLYVSDVRLFISLFVNLARVTILWGINLWLSPTSTCEAVPEHPAIRANSTLAALHCQSFLGLCLVRLRFLLHFTAT